jgi:selenoprotein W-related protein
MSNEPTQLPRIEIEFCTQCRWLLRAGWMAQELLTTFQDEIGEVALIPGTGGIFEIRTLSPAGERRLIWSRKDDGGFPELKDLKQRLRDVIAPDKPLGHSDHKHPTV